MSKSVHICLMARASKGDTLKSIIHNKPLVRTWQAFTTLKEAIEFGDKHKNTMIGVITVDNFEEIWK